MALPATCLDGTSPRPKVAWLTAFCQLSLGARIVRWVLHYFMRPVPVLTCLKSANESYPVNNVLIVSEYGSCDFDRKSLILRLFLREIVPDPASSGRRTAHADAVDILQESLQFSIGTVARHVPDGCQQHWLGHESESTLENSHESFPPEASNDETEAANPCGARHQDQRGFLTSGFQSSMGIESPYREIREEVEASAKESFRHANRKLNSPGHRCAWNPSRKSPVPE